MKVLAAAILMCCVAPAVRGAAPATGAENATDQISPLGQIPPGVPPPGLPPIIRGPVPRPAGFTADVEVFLRQLAASYAAATSYRDRGRVKLVQRSGRVRTTTETPMELTFERPGRLRLDAGQYVIVCDGTTLRTIAPGMGQFTEIKAPEMLDRKDLAAGSVLGGSDEGHPELIDLLLKPGAFDQLVSQITAIEWRPEAVVDGIRCRVLAYETAQHTRLVNYIDPERLVLLKIEAQTLPDPAAPVPMSVDVLYEFTPVELNLKLEASSFASVPPPGAKKVNQLGAMTEPGEAGTGAPGDGQEAAVAPIVGKVAPPIAGKDLAGVAETGVEFHGKTVLLFFWSVGGGQHCLNAIPVMQQLAEELASRKDFLLLGINADPELAETVDQLMKRKKATFRTILDEGLKLHRAYELGGVPSFVLVGPDGNVAWATLGSSPSLKADILTAVSKTLPAAGQ